MKVVLVVFIVVGLMMYASCQTKGGNDGFKNVDVVTFDEMASGEDVVILDVRTPEEIAQGKIPNALEMDVKSDDFSKKIAELSKDKTYLVYCRSGRRSKKACGIMKEHGMNELVNLEGGFLAWSKVHK